MEIISRKEAKGKGLTRYFTGNPCLRGHISERNIVGTCIDCKTEDRKVWTKDNPEKAKAITLRQKEKNPNLYKESSIRYKIKNRELHILKTVKHRAKSAGIEFNLTIEDIVIPEFCPIFKDIKLNTSLGKGSYGPNDDSPSIDRIDSSKGYIKGNVSIISNRANRIKNDGSREEHELIVKFMKENGL
jgi:hypothetical protein